MRKRKKKRDRESEKKRERQRVKRAKGNEEKKSPESTYREFFTDRPFLNRPETLMKCFLEQIPQFASPEWTMKK